uniref:HYDIN/VesB/CFA65-like Ig-like domain-containing protein n=1 Tax=Sinocyclocheilus anshuiensis TaxID=1608454 RepID=A0A671PFL8_9TELE
MFQPYTSEIVFQNYSPFKTYKVPRLVKVIEEDSLYLKVVSPLDASKKVAPGMASTFTVLFTPQENKDYFHRLICVTVTIHAIGPRAILDFPDSRLHFQVCPVKCLSQRTLLVRNIGKCEAKFKLSTCSPFSVEPSIGTLDVGQSMQVTVEFLPKTTGDHSQDLLLHYYSGEDIQISLYGESADINVGLDKYNYVFSLLIWLLCLQKGEIWPNSTAEVNIIFKPQEARIYQQTLPLCIQAEGVDPKLQFNFDFLDMGNIVIGSKQIYKVQFNKGLINDAYELVKPSTVLCLCFSFNPSEGMMPPEASHTLEVHFSSDKLGVFSEELHFSVVGNPEPVIGCLIGPTFHFSVPELNFGEVSFGFPQMLTCRLSNTSVVPMSFGLWIPGDGTEQASITSTDQVAQLNRSEWGPEDKTTKRPKDTGTVRATAEIDFQVCLVFLMLCRAINILSH